MSSLHPIDNIEWVATNSLYANDYNPNVVMTKELELLVLSLTKHGWLHPILVSADGTIIDGFHRWFLASTDEKVKTMSQGKVPIIRLNMDEAERKLLTVRINRAKGSHIAVKMSDLIKSLIFEHELTVEKIAAEIGGTRDEVDLLLQDNVFTKFDIENHKYSKAWYPDDSENGLDS